MDYLFSSGKTVKAVEVLHFEEAEIEKYKGSHETFGAMGPLEVLYFKDYDRFVLQLNDWRYPLLSRLPIILSSDRNNTSHRTYVFPGTNGSTYQLKILNVPNHQALINFETILDHHSDFSVKGEDVSKRVRELSPEDKLVRHTLKNTGTKEVVTENVKQVIHKVMNKAATLKSGTKYLTSTKKRIDMSKIKNKNFKKSAKSSFKKSFFTSNQKLTDDFMKLRRENKNLFEAKELSALKKTSHAPIHHIFREVIEEVILNNKELATQGNFVPTEEKKKGMIDNLKESLHNIKEMAQIKKNELIGGTRAADHTLTEEKSTEISTHHSAA